MAIGTDFHVAMMKNQTIAIYAPLTSRPLDLLTLGQGRLRQQPIMFLLAAS